MSYRTSDPLHAAVAAVLGLAGLAVSALAAGSWWYMFHRDQASFEMVAVSVIPTVLGLGLVGFAIWVFVDIVRVRREEK